MLTKLCIRNIALIEYAEIDFEPGLNILSGETGAGKSIVIDAMNLALGTRADKEIIKTGCDEATVEALFDISALEPVREILRDMDMEDAGELILSRRVTATGRNVCRVNGFITPLAQLRRLTARLIDILGQHEHQSLLEERLHLGLLDSYAGQSVAVLLQDMSRCYGEYHRLQGDMQRLYGTADERLRRADILRYQIEEIESAALRAGEEEEIAQRIEFLKHAADITQAVQGAADGLRHGQDRGVAALELMGDAVESLRRISHISPEYAALFAKTEQVLYQMEDVADELQLLESSLEYDEGELDALVERDERIRRLSRKYGQGIPGILQALEDMRRELHGIEHADEQLEGLTRQLELAGKKAMEAAQKLSDARKKAAEGLQADMLSNLRELGMEHARFKVDFGVSGQEEPLLRATGIDEVRFLISPNPGEALKSLARTASGGEMSRIMLAMKNITAGADGIPTLIFDEIDTGISGGMARVVAEKLCSIAGAHQVICVTHTPVIAAMGDHHFYIEKQTDGEHTATHITKLAQANRVAEIGRLVGGDMTSAGQEHATQMLAWAQSYKSSRG